MESMDARLVNDTPDAAMIRVTDPNGVDHRVAVDKHSGEIAVHQYNEYPDPGGGRSTEQDRVIRAVRTKARYAAHYRTDAAIVRASDLPENIRSAIGVLEAMGDGEFLRYFRAYYEAIESPPVHVDPDHIETVATVLYLDRRSGADPPRLEYATAPAVRVVTDAGSRWEYDNPADAMAAPDRDPDVIVRQPPGEVPVEFGDPFREYLVDHLRCQIRDVHWIRGDRIPSDCRLDGYGNPEIERLRRDPRAEPVEG